MRQPFYKSVGKSILAVLLMIAALTILSSAMIELSSGSVTSWKEWCYQARYALFFWRLVIYLVLLKVWLSLRKQFEQNSFSHRKTLYRLEMWFTSLIALNEYCNYLQLTQGGAL